MILRLLGAALAAAVLSACATPPKEVQFVKARSFAMSKDAVWDSVLHYFTANSIQIKTIEKDSGVIYAERSRYDASMADCGEVPLSQEVSRIATLNVFVRPAGNLVQVTVNTDFNVVRVFDNQSWTDRCFSTGVLEGQILSAIGAPVS